MFKDYKDAYDQMEANLDIKINRKAIAFYQERVAELEKPYRDRMATAATAITAAVLETKKTTTLFGVIAKFAKGRKSVSWKSVAQAFRVSDKFVLQYTNFGKPKVTIKIKALSS